ncbi:MAG: GAF domain-containing protein [Myxococcales bacterium]|nr:GAF domain-containing protein [Myxococcales bacterium]MCB9708191.1 GAF domain-containing protein [Myxococcales bacterium]
MTEQNQSAPSLGQGYEATPFQERESALHPRGSEALLPATFQAVPDRMADSATALLLRLTDAISRATTLNEIYEQALDGIREGLGVDRASILTYDESQVMRFRAWRGISADYRDAVDGHCPWAPDARDPEPVLIEDVETADGMAPYRELFRAEHIGALAFVPLVYRSRLLGKFMLYYARPHCFSSAELRLIAAVARQIAFAVDRKRTEVDLQQTREKLVLVLRGLADGVTAQASDGKLLFANPAAARIFGYASIEELVAMPLSDLWRRYDMTDENGQSLEPEHLPWCIALKKGLETEALLCLRERTVAREQWFLVRSSPALGKDGDVMFAVNVFRDVTRERQRLRAEDLRHTEIQLARTRAAFLADAGKLLASSLEYEAASLAKLAALAVPRLADWCIVELNDEQRLEHLAVAYRDPTGEALANSLKRRFIPDSHQPKLFHRVINTGRAELYPDLTEDLLGEMIDDEVAAGLVQRLQPRSAISVPMPVAGRVLGAITLISTDPSRRYDINDLEVTRSLAERAAFAVDNARLYAEAKEAVQAREDFLAMVSHDLRNPLSVILLKSGFLKMDLTESGADPKFLRDVEAIVRASKSMERLIRDLFDFTSIEAGHLRVETRFCQLKQLLHEAIEFHRPLVGGRKLSIENQLPDDAEVYCDRERISQVFSNLIGNAIKFTAADGVIMVMVSSQDGDIVLSVKDNGIGMCGEDKAHAFDRYGKGRSPGRRGLGLGLYITKALVEAHQGRVWIDSQVNHGTTVHFSLPVVSRRKKHEATTKMKTPAP